MSILSMSPMLLQQHRYHLLFAPPNRIHSVYGFRIHSIYGFSLDFVLHFYILDSRPPDFAFHLSAFWIPPLDSKFYLWIVDSTTRDSKFHSSEFWIPPLVLNSIPLFFKLDPSEFWIPTRWVLYFIPLEFWIQTLKYCWNRDAWFCFVGWSTFRAICVVVTWCPISSNIFIIITIKSYTDFFK